MVLHQRFGRSHQRDAIPQASRASLLMHSVTNFLLVRKTKLCLVLKPILFLCTLRLLAGMLFPLALAKTLGYWFEDGAKS
jgi:hypothetical protein